MCFASSEPTNKHDQQECLVYLVQVCSSTQLNIPNLWKKVAFGRSKVGWWSHVATTNEVQQ